MTKVSVSESSEKTEQSVGIAPRTALIDARALILDMISRTPEIRDGVTVHRINDSKLWYLGPEQAKAYLAVDSSEEYKKGMHDAEQNLLDRNMSNIIARMQDQVSFIDLGCGNAKMTIGIVKRAELRDKNIVFYPVDISADILRVAVQNAHDAGITNVHGWHGDFEKLGELLTGVDPQRQRFFNLGANFVNFNSDKILSLISSNMRAGDLVYFSAQLGNGNSDAIVEQYRRNAGAVGMTLGALAYVGVAPENVHYDARMNPVTREIECFVTVNQLTEDLKSARVKVGDEIVVITSFKPTLEKFKEIANRYFEGEFLFNESGTYVGFIGKKKGSGMHPAVEHYTAEGYKSVENTSSRDFQRYMADEKAVITGIEGSKDRTFVDLGAGNGRVIHEISAVARNVIAIDINRDMLEGLTKRALGLSNVKPVLGDMLQLESILSSEDVQRPVLLLLQNTLAIVDRQILAEMRKVAKNLNGDIVISLLKQEALKESGIPFYRTIPGVVGEPDLEKTDFQKGDFVTKTGYRSKWWRPEERESIRRFFEGDGVVVKEYEGSNYYILHVSYPPPI